VKDLFYKNVGPYTKYNFVDVIKNLPERVDEDIVQGLLDHYNWKINDVYTDKAYEPEHAHELIESAKTDMNNAKMADELLAEYLEIPIEKRKYEVRLKKSKYKKGAYSLPINKTQWRDIIYLTDDLNIGKNRVSTTLGTTGINTHTIGRGYDSKGEYRSYGDSYDLNPFRGNNAIIDIPVINKINDLSFGLGKPVELYDRIYLDDYYKVPDPYRGGTYLPEVVVYPSQELYKRK
jgi:hypothetical protein